MRFRFVVIIASALIAVVSIASAQMMQVGVGSNLSIPSVPCNAGQLDFSDGCNTTEYMVFLR